MVFLSQRINFFSNIILRSGKSLDNVSHTLAMRIHANYNNLPNAFALFMKAKPEAITIEVINMLISLDLTLAKIMYKIPKNPRKS